ncbi:hypothetical protein GBAR_LOCUS24710 [Geodia barretti]|uniref:Uncharacterized protein n=1 Tax=Geodia barretti TaxID=519541 RepID=A0AA35TB21_GEOBA|nr:hypothetical protein GBAR_LOCUS24710 [Geodia barretti]
MKKRGIVKGQTIVFDEPLGLEEGQSVEIEIRTIEEPIPNTHIDRELCGSPQNIGDEETGTSQGRAAKVFLAIPAGRNPVTNEMVNELREQLGI